jgi:hypothetical protein
MIVSFIVIHTYIHPRSCSTWNNRLFMLKLVELPNIGSLLDSLCIKPTYYLLKYLLNPLIRLSFYLEEQVVYVEVGGVAEHRQLVGLLGDWVHLGVLCCVI